MKPVKIYYLSSCDTCQKILKALSPGPEAKLQDIKFEKISTGQLAEMAQMSGSYESLFSRRALKYKAMGLAKMTLTEENYRDYILEEYTFLKRPVVIIGEEIFVGNTAEVVAAATRAMQA